MVDKVDVPILKTEEEIGLYLRRHLKELIPGIKVLATHHELRDKGQAIDILIDADIGGVKKILVCEIKSVGEPRYLFQAIGKLKQITSSIHNSYAVIVAPFISERGQDICKVNEIGYIDLSGNVFLKFRSVYIEKVGKKQLQKSRKTLKRLFSPVSSRIIRVLLEDPQRTWRLIKISEESKASLGYVHKVINSLHEQGYVEKEKTGIKITEPGKLLDLWAEEYDFSLNKVYSFYSFIKEPLKIMQRIEEASRKLGSDYAMTMHAGASLVAPFVRFTDVHFYFMGDHTKWVKELDLRPIEFGSTIHLIEPYDSSILYKTRKIKAFKVASNIQLYLDLYKYPTRGAEQAEYLRKEKIGY